MVDRLQLPRAVWKTHPNYPRQLLLLSSHRSFRATSQMLIERARQEHRRAATLASFSWWKSAMSRHEHYEEAKLYPFLEHRWGLDFTAMRGGHAELGEADAQVRSAQTTDALVEALHRHHEILMEHLDKEEQLVIPALLELSRQEFETYTHRSLSWCLRTLPCHAGEAGCAVCAPWRNS